MKLTSSVIAVVPAAGIGQRMQAKRPKQYLRIGAKTILEYTLEVLLSCCYIERIIVALKENDPYYRHLVIAVHPRITTVIGGATRAESVLAALQELEPTDWVLVHDAVRPCVTESDIKKLIEAVVPNCQGGILATPLLDTIKQASADEPVYIEKTQDRNRLWAALTPQCFLTKNLKMAIEQALDDQLNITDEAEAIEYSGGQPLLIAGRRDNIKITYPEDISLAQFYLHNRIYTKEKQCE